jgi:NDP-sugar pyrophosphorylase family protein
VRPPPGTETSPLAPSPLTLVILVAGLGSRFSRGVPGGGRVLPKWLVPVGPEGESIIELNVRAAESAGFGRFVLVTRSALAGETATAVESWPATRDVSVVYQEVVGGERSKPLGTAHALLAARHEVEAGGRFGVANGDDVYGKDGFERLAGILDATSDHGLVAYRLGNTLLGDRPVSRAVCELDGGDRLRRLTEGTVWRDGTGRYWWHSGGPTGELSGETLVSTNLWAFRSRIFTDLAEAVDGFLRRDDRDEEEEVLLPRVVDAIASRERISVAAAPGACYGLTHPDDLAELRRLLARTPGRLPPA